MVEDDINHEEGVKGDKKFVSNRVGHDRGTRESKDSIGKNQSLASDGGAGITQSLPQSKNVNLNISTFEANLSTAADYKPNRIGTLKQTGHNKLKLKRKFSELDGD